MPRDPVASWKVQTTSVVPGLLAVKTRPSKVPGASFAERVQLARSVASKEVPSAITARTAMDPVPPMSGVNESALVTLREATPSVLDDEQAIAANANTTAPADGKKPRREP